MPGFLKRAEQKLLLNKPLIWSTRVHLVLYFGILFNLLLTGICFLAPMELLERSIAGYWIGFVIIIAMIALTVWIIYLLRFNVFKKYGNIKPLHALVTFLLYFISTGIIVLSVFVYPAVECVRANMAFGDKELVQDINTMNIRLCQIEHPLLNTAWDYDTVALVQDEKPVEKKITYNEEEEATDAVAMPFNGRYFFKLDSTDFYGRLAQTDSVVKLNDSLYLMYKTPALQFVSSYAIEEFTSEKVLHSFEIYYKALKQPPTAAEIPAIAKEFNQLENKYNKLHPGYQEEVEQGDTPEDIVQKKHHVGRLNSNIEHLVSKKYSFIKRYLSDNIRLFYYFVLAITLLVFIFRHTTVRTFFLSLLTGVLISIFMAMVLSFSHAGGAAFSGWVIGYTLLFFVGSIFTFSLSKRRVVNGILINLFVFIIPVLPLLVVEFIYELTKEQFYLEYGTYHAPFMKQYFLYAEIGGAVLLLVLLATYINKLYRRWYSLPEH
jgi:hypothetical protein